MDDLTRDPFAGEERPRPAPPAVTPQQRARGEHLVAVHDMYRANLDQVARVLDAVAPGEVDVGEARAAVHGTGLRATYEQLGSFCGQACSMVEVHHTIEDVHMYPPLRAADPDGLGPALDRLGHEHVVIHAVLVELDADLVTLVAEPARLARVHTGFRRLHAMLLSHFAYEEDVLVDAIGHHGVVV